MRSQTGSERTWFGASPNVEINGVVVMVTHNGECFCGAVQIEVSGEPEVSGYCHCRSCRSWSGGPVNAFTLWKPDAVQIKARGEYVGTFQKTAVKSAAILQKMRRPLDDQPSSTGSHRCLRGHAAVTAVSPQRPRQLCGDGPAHAGRLPKLKDFPTEFGGSGQGIAE